MRKGEEGHTSRAIRDGDIVLVPRCSLRFRVLHSVRASLWGVLEEIRDIGIRGSRAAIRLGVDSDVEGGEGRKVAGGVWGELEWTG